MNIISRQEEPRMSIIVEQDGSAPARTGDLSLAEQAYRLLRDKLVMLEIRPGDIINDAHIAAEMGVGRTPVREAIKRLEGDHLLVSYPRRGTFATSVDITELAEVSEIREMLEPLAARRAATLASDDTRAEARSLAATIADLDNGKADQRTMMRYDVRVHRLIYRAAASSHLEEVLIRYDNLATRMWCLVLDRMHSVAGHINEHIDLLNAIADGDAEGASKLALNHVVNFERTIREIL